ncbi:MAG: hypothetical protein M3P43_03305 [Actinomycetota bacterium]|nr:hypothetical protein [Actinomycetota bacterium]
MTTTRTERPTRGRGLGLTFGQILVFTAVLLPAVVSLRASMATIDLAYQIRAGEIMLNGHHVLRTDPFTFTTFGRPWLDQQWGAQILLAQIFRWGSWELLDLTRAALAAASFWLLNVACRARGAGVRPAAWLSLGGLLVAFYGFEPRPQMFAFLLFAMTIAVISERERHPRLLWLLPLIVLVWANVHGSFVLGPAMVLLAWLEDRRLHLASSRTTLFVTIATIAAATVNPFGLRVWSYVVELSSNPQVRNTIEEWQPPKPASVIGFVFFASVAVVAAIALRRRREIAWPRVLGLVLFFLLGVTAVRGVIWWALAAPFLLADLFPGRSTRDEPKVVNTAIAVVLVGIGLMLLPWFRPTFPSTSNSGTVSDGLLAYAPDMYTTRLADAVEPGTRVFAPEIWASWFELAVPQFPVMIDPRIEIFADDVWRDYDGISQAAGGWQRILARWDIGALALSTKQQPDLIAVIKGDPNWKVLYADDDGVLLIRSSVGT